MAITRAQQAKQMLRDGGMSLQEAKDMAPEGEFLAYINPKEAKMLKAAGGSGVMTKAGIPSFVDFGNYADVAQAAAGGEFGGGSPQETFGGDDQEDDNARMMQAMNLIKAPPTKPTNIGGSDGPSLNFAEKFRIASLKNLYDQKTGQKKAIPSISNILSAFKPAQEFYTEEDDELDQYGLSGKTLTDLNRLAKAINEGERTGNISQTEFEKAFYGPEGPRQLGSSNDTSDPFVPTIPLIPKIATDLAEEDELAKALSNRTAYRFMADGGIMGGLADGQMDEMGRQMYGLGKLVKKVTRGVKKIAKSPIGKAALLYAGTAGLGSLGAGQGFGSLFKLGTYAPSTVGANLGTAFTRFMGGKLAPNLVDEVALTGKQNLLQKAISNFPGGVVGAITAVSLLPLLGIGTGDESEEEAQAILKDKGIDIADIRANPQKYQAIRFMAEGGSTEKEPVAKKTMPLLDMNGMEKDYRAEGGFVPIGRMEKADDVPARLSKNEFVFTADAVRNAGDGNVDKGAEVMYNMMKNLEAGGDVSKESQGLEGARKMFQTSQRLEEVL